MIPRCSRVFKIFSFQLLRLLTSCFPRILPSDIPYSLMVLLLNIPPTSPYSIYDMNYSAALEVSYVL